MWVVVVVVVVVGGCGVVWGVVFASIKTGWNVFHIHIRSTPIAIELFGETETELEGFIPHSGQNQIYVRNTKEINPTELLAFLYSLPLSFFMVLPCRVAAFFCSAAANHIRRLICSRRDG